MEDIEFGKDITNFKNGPGKVRALHEKISFHSLKTPYDTAILFKDTLKDKLCFCENKWFYFDNNVWRETKTVTLVLSCEIKKMTGILLDFCKEMTDNYEEQKLKQNKERYKTYDDEIEKINIFTKRILDIFETKDKSGFLQLLTSHLAILLRDDTFSSKLDTNRYQLVFKNGILNLKDGSFRNGLQATDYATKFININYAQSSEEDTQKIREIFFKIGNAKEEHADYFSSVLGYSLLGDAVLEKAFWSLVGQRGDNGKTTILDSLSSVMPDYCVKVSNKAFYENVANRHKYLAKIKGARIIYVEENIDDKSLDASFLKEVADGRRINYEVLYGNSTTAEITGKVFIVSNNTPIFKTDGGLKNRYRQCQFNSHFGKDNTEDNYTTKEFIQDKKLLTKLENELALPLINYLVGFSKKYYDTKELKKMPKEWEEITKETLSDNDKISIFIEEFMDITGQENDRIQKDEIEFILRDKGITLAQFRDEMRTKGMEYNKDKKKNNKKGVWVGIKLKQE